MKYSLAGADIDALDYALDQVEKNADDSDRDTFSDYEEIAALGTNPNDPASRPAVVEPTAGAGGASEGGVPGVGGTPASGGAPGVGGAPASGGAAAAAGSAGVVEPSQCTPTEPPLPSAQYGCQFRKPVPANVGFQAAMLAGCCLVAHGARVRRRRRSSRGAA